MRGPCFSIPIMSINPSHMPVISYPIIKRRIAWLIGKWVSNMCARADSPAIWEVLVHLLRDRGPGTDAVVRFTAATVVKICVDVSGITSGAIAFPEHIPVEHRVRCQRFYSVSSSCSVGARAVDRRGRYYGWQA